MYSEASKLTQDIFITLILAGRVLTVDTAPIFAGRRLHLGTVPIDAYDVVVQASVVPLLSLPPAGIKRAKSNERAGGSRVSNDRNETLPSELAEWLHTRIFQQLFRIRNGEVRSRRGGSHCPELDVSCD